MALFEQWTNFAEEKQNQPDAQEFWNAYFLKERDMYVELLQKKKFMKKSVADHANSFGIDTINMMGFIDGINESLVTELDLNTVEEDTVISLKFDKEKLFYNMVAAKADWLYNLPQWDELLTAERRKEIYKEQKKSTTVVNTVKVGRNDPCPCGSGKKYKKCCGR